MQELRTLLTPPFVSAPRTADVTKEDNIIFYNSEPLLTKSVPVVAPSISENNSNKHIKGSTHVAKKDLSNGSEESDVEDEDEKINRSNLFASWLVNCSSTKGYPSLNVALRKQQQQVITNTRRSSLSPSPSSSNAHNTSSAISSSPQQYVLQRQSIIALHPHALWVAAARQTGQTAEYTVDIFDLASFHVEGKSQKNVAVSSSSSSSSPYALIVTLQHAMQRHVTAMQWKKGSKAVLCVAAADGAILVWQLDYHFQAAAHSDSSAAHRGSGENHSGAATRGAAHPFRAGITPTSPACVLYTVDNTLLRPSWSPIRQVVCTALGSIASWITCGNSGAPSLTTLSSSNIVDPALVSVGGTVGLFEARDGAHDKAMSTPGGDGRYLTVCSAAAPTAVVLDLRFAPNEDRAVAAVLSVSHRNLPAAQSRCYGTTTAAWSQHNTFLVWGNGEARYDNDDIGAPKSQKRYKKVEQRNNGGSLTVAVTNVRSQRVMEQLPARGRAWASTTFAYPDACPTHVVPVSSPDPNEQHMAIACRGVHGVCINAFWCVAHDIRQQNHHRASQRKRHRDDYNPSRRDGTISSSTANQRNNEHDDVESHDSHAIDMLLTRVETAKLIFISTNRDSSSLRFGLGGVEQHGAGDAIVHLTADRIAGGQRLAVALASGHVAVLSISCDDVCSAASGKDARMNHDDFCFCARLRDTKQKVVLHRFSSSQLPGVRRQTDRVVVSSSYQDAAMRNPRYATDVHDAYGSSQYGYAFPTAATAAAQPSGSSRDAAPKPLTDRIGGSAFNAHAVDSQGVAQVHPLMGPQINCVAIISPAALRVAESSDDTATSALSLPITLSSLDYFNFNDHTHNVYILTMVNDQGLMHFLPEDDVREKAA